ncbi:MAG: hypothetical protein ACK5XA_08475 [Tagaea sp.]
MSTFIDWEVRECRPDDADEDWVARVWNCTARTHIEAQERAAAAMDLSKDWLIAKPVLWVVSVHLTDRGYGGPEEGGWYFDFGHPIGEWDWARLVIDHGLDPAQIGPRVFGNHRDAVNAAYLLNGHLGETANKNRPPIYSTQSVGQYRAIVQQGMTPQPWPTETPRYE